MIEITRHIVGSEETKLQNKKDMVSSYRWAGYKFSYSRRSETRRVFGEWCLKEADKLEKELNDERQTE